MPFEPEPRVERICGPGVDPAFDQLIAALGHIASPKPKALIDSMMLWRKSKSDAASEARSHLQQSRANLPPGPLLRRNTEPVNAGVPGMDTSDHNTSSNSALAAKQEYLAHAERRSTVSIYILCRVLLEVICQSNLASITLEMEDKLESIIFSQLKIADPDSLIVSPLKMSNWNLFARLLGHMSSINFQSVTRRFLEDLEGSLQERIVRSPTSLGSRDSDGKIELVLGGMKHLRLKISPEEAWEQSCDFLISLGRLFNRSHGPRVKTSFCQMIEMLILPIAAKASNSHLMHPRWAEVISAIGPRLAQMFIKPRHWAVAFPLTATMLCVSSPDNFLSQWLQMILPLQSKVKDRYTKQIGLQVISRLVWTYLYRCNENPKTAVRKLDEVMKFVLPTSKRSLVASDSAITDPLIQIIRVAAFKYPEYCFRTVVFPLINAELFTANKELRVDQLDPDRIVVGIRAFLCIMSDLEKGEQGQPPFPESYDAPPPAERTPTSPVLSTSRDGSVASPSSAARDDTVYRPVLTHVLSDSVRDFYYKFCEILGKITIVCDNAFGGQVSLDEKFSTPKTPSSDSFNFARRDDHLMASDHKQAFYELLHVAVQALPRCLSADIPFNSLINLLCTGTAHVQYNIAESSASSLKAIARQSHAQQVTMGFSRFIFNFDDRYSTMSDGGMLGPGHIENTLKLYVELLQIWIEEIQQKRLDASADANGDGAADMRGLKLDFSSIWAEVEQVEAHGLFFLCSQSRRVRHFAVTVLRLITEFDQALARKETDDKDTTRLIHVMENHSDEALDLINEDQLSVAERSRLQRGQQSTSNQGVVVELCSSDVSYDATLWYKVFPNLIHIMYDKCPFTIVLARNLVCNRILQLYKPIVILSEPTRGLFNYNEPGSGRVPARSPAAQPEMLVEQWKLYLIFACTTLNDPGSAPAPVAAKDAQHVRKGSKSSGTDDTKIVNARNLFKYLNPLLQSSSASVREAVVVALGSINIHIYRTLLEELQGQVSRCNDEARARIHQRTNSSPRRNRKMDLLRTEITHVLKLTAHYLTRPEIYQSDFFLETLTTYARDLKLFLMDGEVQMDWEFQKLRRHYCGLMEALFEGINLTEDPSRWMTFESRKSAFSLMEDWCGFSPNQPQIRAREDTMRQSLINQQTLNERGTLTAAMEIEKRNLRTAALSAMAALCGGPFSVKTEGGVTLQFDIRRMLAWIDAIFSSGSDRMNVIGRRALTNLIDHNPDHPWLIEHCIGRCYLADTSKLLDSYFSVVVKVLENNAEHPCPFWRLLGLCLFTLGNEQSEIRSRSAGILRLLESRQQRNSKIRDFDISIADKTQAVYKLAQFEISKRLAQQYNEVAFHIFSEFSMYFKELHSHSQRNLVAVVLPWIQSMELALDPNGGPTAHSYVLLANLLELTIKSSLSLHNEVQALWQALTTGPHPGNVRLVLDFIIQQCLERREQNFVEYAKQIVVFLSTTSTTPSSKVVDFLLLQINPKAMVPNEKREAIAPPADINLLPYCADLNEALPVGTKQAGFSLGQLSLILLVDLMVAPAHVAQDDVPLLLHVVLVLWDHYTPLVQEQAREMLVHLVHELVISRMDEALEQSSRKAIEDLVEKIRQHDRAVVWSYEDSNGKMDDLDNKVPAGMECLSAEVVKTFEMVYPGVKENWGRLSLTWATSCPVRHLACRSFQIFRCVLTSLDQYMLGDMLARLSNTIADEDPEIQSFSMEILTTLKTLIMKLDTDRLLTFPQLFWTTCACLESINEREYLEAVEMLNELLLKLDFTSANVRRLLSDGQPARWEGGFDGIQPLLHKGLRSSLCWQPSLDTMEKLAALPPTPLTGDDERLFFALLANFPRFLHELEQSVPSDAALRTARTLLHEADRQGLGSLAAVLDDFALQRVHDGQDFLAQYFVALREFYLPHYDFKMITFLIGLLTNSLSWVKIQTMRILCVAIPEVDMRNPELAGHGSDLISPLLRLLQTEFCMEALEVLDNIMTMSGNHMDKHHLRMSMTRSTSKAIRKEYERTQSLFGIPEASGWAIPVPGKKTDATRANIHAAFYMCQSDEGSSTEATPTAEVEFHNDEFAYGYFDASERSDTMLSDDGRGDTGVGDLVNKLDSLDDFFDEPSSPQTDDDGRSSRTITEFTPENFESGATLYDEQILPILHQASNNTSFQNGFADRSIPMSREASSNAMNPGAFTMVANMAPARPALHSRSITSPSAPASYQPHLADVGSDEEYMSGGFSDADDERPNTSNMEDAFPLEATYKSHAQPPVPRLRRLASRSRDDRYRDRLPRPPGPRVGVTNYQPNPGNHGDMGEML